MYGAILGDIIGSPYEFNRGDKTKDFKLFDEKRYPTYTDDSVMTVAIAKGIMEAGTDASEEDMKEAFIRYMVKYGLIYAHGHYGNMFSMWLRSFDHKPYGSYGNGSAMRVSSIGWLYDSLEDTARVARWSAEVTHNHPEGIKGAETIATSIFLARNGYSKNVIRKWIEETYGYDLSRTCDEIRPTYRMDETCQGSCPEAIISFLEGKDFEDVIRNAVSLGGDTDTVACMAGSIAEAYYGVPKKLKSKSELILPVPLVDILKEFLIFSDYKNKAKKPLRKKEELNYGR